MDDYYNGDFQNDNNQMGQMNEQQAPVYTYIPTEPGTPRKPKKTKKNGGFWKKAGMFVLCGALVGGAGAGSFIGVMKASGYEAKLEKAVAAAKESQTTKVQTAETTATGSSGSSTSGTTTVADVAEGVMPSIVAITNTQVYQSNDWSYFFGGNSGSKEVTGSGSGIIIGQNDTELLVLTNYHVIEGANSLTVSFIDGTTADAQIKGTAESNDLAVVAIPRENLSDDTKNRIKIATLGDSDGLRVGDEVVAIGNALGYGQSLTYGHVSALSRDVTIDNKTLTLLQTDAAINPGNSGGALLNMNGEVIGINSAKYSSEEVEGMGFAIPITEAKDIINNLMMMNEKTKTEVSEDEASWLGINGVAVNESNAQLYNMPQGVYVYSIVENGPAASSDLQEKDIITAIEGTGISSMDELKEQLKYYAGGEKVTLTVERLANGAYEEVSVDVTLGYKKDYQSSDQQQNGQNNNGQSNGQGGFAFPGQN